MIPKIDSEIGILTHTTNYSGCGGRIRVHHGDFKVLEILDKKTLESFSQDTGYAVYKLKKSGIDTNHALQTITKKFGVRLKALGLKDSAAVSEQFVCSMAKNRLLSNHSNEKFSLEKVGFAKKPLSAKDMVGNHFVIKITDAEHDISDFAEHDKVLNFYGYQRFGSTRPMTHLVGKALVQKRFADAVDIILSYTSEYDSEENTKIRKIMADPSKYSEALRIIPKQMDLETILLREMISHGDPQKAFCKLPLPVRRLFVDAYRSYLFNLTLSKSYRYGEELFVPQQDDVCFDKHAKLGKYEMEQHQHTAVPMVGYSYFKKTRFDHHISKILEEQEVSPKDFYIKEMQEISSEGGFRTARLVCGDFAAKNDTASFTLQRGSFATILMREIMKPADPLKATF